MATEIQLPTISKITHEDGCYTFSITRQMEDAEYDETTQTLQSVVREVTTHYSTNKSGMGLWVGEYPAGKQILGTSQFDLNPSNRRARVKLFALEHTVDFKHFCTQDGLGQNYSSADLFYRIHA